MGAFDKVLGTLLVGIIFNTYLYGIVTYQFASYFHIKFNDPLWVKAVVLFLFLLDTVHSISAVYLLWQLCVENYTNPPALAVTFWPLPFTPIAIALSAFCTQTFLIYRIFRLTAKPIPCAIILVFSTASCAMGLACGVKAWPMKLVSRFSELNNLATYWLSMQVGIDAVITFTLIVILLDSRTGFHSTDTVINRLIRGVIQTGLLCGIISICSLYFFKTHPQTNYYSMFAIPIGRVYTNTLMDTLLARESLRGVFSEPVPSAGPTDTLFSSQPGLFHSQTGQTNSIQLHVRTNPYTTTENDLQRRPSSEAKYLNRTPSNDIFPNSRRSVGKV